MNRPLTNPTRRIPRHLLCAVATPQIFDAFVERMVRIADRHSRKHPRRTERKPLAKSA